MEINYIHTEDIHNSIAATEVLPYLFNLIHPESVVDIGCGTGSWLTVAKQLGAKKILGLDGVHVDTAMLRISEEEFLQHNLTLPLKPGQLFDMAICLEVAEHLPGEAAYNIIDIITSFSDVVLFSAAIPGQGGQAHLNEQWPAYWQNKFASHGFFPCDILRQEFWNNDKIEWWYKQNMLLYAKADAISKFNLQTSLTIPVYIHPELFEHTTTTLAATKKHVQYLENIIDKEITRPRFYPSLKRLIKSVIK
jgi:SAM-dependent methyltransferase